MEGAAFSQQRDRWVASGRASHRRLVLRLDDERSKRWERSLELAVEVGDAVDHLAVLRDGGGGLSVLVEDGDSGDNLSRVVRVLSALLDQLVGLIQLLVALPAILRLEACVELLIVELLADSGKRLQERLIHTVDLVGEHRRDLGLLRCAHC